MAPSRRGLPDGCHLLGAARPVEQMESERASSDPYRRQRVETAEKGGNVLLAISDTIVRRPNLDCPSNDTSPDCLRGAQSWYRVAFEEYACSPEAVERLAALPAEPDRGGITIRFPAGRKSASPALSTTQMKQKILRMMSEGLTPDVIATWVRGERLISRLSAEDLVEWKRAGIPDEVLKAAAER